MSVFRLETDEDGARLNEHQGRKSVPTFEGDSIEEVVEKASEAIGWEVNKDG